MINECFVARDGELEAMRGALQEAREGRPAVVTIEGEPGIGKTSLLHRFLAEAPDVQTLWASGDETEISLEHGISSQLRAQMPSDAGATGTPVPSAGTSASDGFAVGAALLAGLGVLQERGVVVVVVDDLQWADLPSARALLFALRRLRKDSVLVLLTTRLHSLGRLGDSWSRLLSQGQRLRLSGLAPRDLSPLASTLFGVDLSPAARDRLCAHTGGNPLYVRALLEELPATAVADMRSPLPAPHSYAATVITRVARLSDAAQNLLQAGSVAGHHFPLPVAAMMAGIGDAATAFDEACAARLLTSALRPGHEEAAFTHPLVRAAIYDDLSASRRRQLHLAVAHLVPGPASLRHRAAAAQGADDELATELAAMAESDFIAGELPNAAQHLLAAAELTADRAPREEYLLRAVELLLMSGDADAHSYLEAVRQGQDGPRKRFICCCLGAAAGRVDAAACAELESIVKSLRLPGDRAVFGPATSSLAMFCSMQGRPGQAMVWAARALKAAGDNPMVDVTARQAMASALAMTGRTPEALALLARLSPARVLPRPFEPELLATRGSLKASAGDFTGAVEDLAAVVRWSRAGAPLRSLPDAYAALAQAEYGLGAWDDAATHAELAVSLARDLGHPWFLAQAHKVAVDIYSARGDWQFAGHHVAGARRAASEMDVPGEAASACVAEATLAWAQSDWEAVLGALAPLHNNDLEVLTANFDPTGWRLQEAEALMATGRLAEAARTLDGAEAAPARPSTTALDLHRLRAGLALAQGRPDEARASFTAGLAVPGQAKRTLGHALLASAYGRFLRTNGNRREAIKCLRSAHDILTGLGATPFLAACDAELSACGVRISGGPAAGNPHGLTAKEQTVARLVAQGLSNREVAAELYLSAKAIEYHLANIFAKLGITSRRQLGAALTLPATAATSSTAPSGQ